ncbi:MAG: hypothetical protein Harvfovirus51_14, partial [Harvfovirus sp.]
MSVTFDFKNCYSYRINPIVANCEEIEFHKELEIRKFMMSLGHFPCIAAHSVKISRFRSKL